MSKRYVAKGYVLGNYWGGGTGAYPARKVTGETKDAVLAEAKKKLDDGSLDSGMGYESLIGAILDIEEIETVTVDGKEFERSENEIEFIGDLNESQCSFLTDCLLQM